jgi:hypothetical protein
MLAALLLLQGAALTPLPTPVIQGELRATRLTGAAPTIDGRLDEQLWAEVAHTREFTQTTPDPGASASEATEVRVLFTDAHLFVGLRLFDREPHLLDLALGRRDEAGPSDWAWVIIDPKRDRRSAYQFMVNAAGARSDLYRFNDGEFDNSWNGVWDVAVTRDSLGWTAEFKIPFSQLQVDAGEEGRIGFNVGRRIFRRNEVAYWRPVPPGTPAFVSLAGDLVGLDQVRTGASVELSPYALAGTEQSSGGLDLRASLPGGLLLTGAVNPDFGQVEADPSQVNLGAGELFFAERRPFFTGGMDLFQFAIAPDRGVNEGLFYSRRLGRAPQIGAGPDATSIIAAAKLTGRSARGWTTGLLAAATAEETGAGGAVVEPHTTYAFGRLGHDWRSGQSTLAFVGGAVLRDQPDEALGLRRAAYTGGVQLQHRFNGDKNMLRMNLSGSRVEGSAEAITRTQRSPVRYLQRPDIDWAEVDSTATSLLGWAAALHLDDHAGRWRWSLDGQSRSPGLEVNDLGFMQSTALHMWQGSVTRYWGTPGRFAREASLRLGTSGQSQWDGTRINASFFTVTNLILPNFWTLNAEVWRRVGGIQTSTLRGGPGLRLSGNDYYLMNVGTDMRGRIRGSFFADYWTYDEKETEGFDLEPSLTWRPASGRELSVGARYWYRREAQQWAGRGVADGSEEITGHLRQHSLGLTMRASTAFTPELSLQAYAEPFVAHQRWRGFERIVAPRAYRLSDRGVDVAVEETGGTYAADLDGNGSFETDLIAEEGRTAKLNANLVLRWEYRTGSTFFLVWQHGRSAYHTGGPATFGSGFDALGQAEVSNALIAKLSYWFTL